MENNILQEQLGQVCYEVNANKISMEKFSEIFKETYKNLLEGRLSSTKNLIEIFIDKVLVYEDCIKVMFKYHPALNNSSISACL